MGAVAIELVVLVAMVAALPAVLLADTTAKRLRNRLPSARGAGQLTRTAAPPNRPCARSASAAGASAIG